MTLRSFADPDLDEVRELIHRTIDECYTAAYPPLAVAFFKRFHSDEAILERAAAGHVVVLEAAGVIVATGAVVGDEISGVFVSPEAQGRGYGAAVMDALESEALAGGALRACLAVSLPARGFYERRGYSMVEDCSLDVGEGQRLDYWQAVKLLGGGSDRALEPGAAPGG